MNNFFINDFAPHTKNINSPFWRFSNKVLKKLTGLTLTPFNDPNKEMNNAEQRINFYHLLNNIIENNVEGEVVELGSYVGQCALIFSKVLETSGSSKTLHLFDSFETNFAEKGNIETLLIENFKNASLPVPVIHKGRFENTLSTELPEKIAFAHIDSGGTDDEEIHKNIIHYCLKEVYPRLSKGAVCILMDYYEPNAFNINRNLNAGVTPATDSFLQDKPEQIISLYAGNCCHAYFKKQ